MEWNKQNKEKLYFGLAFLSFTVGVVLIFTGLLLPPAGVVDGNVLIAVGEFLSMAAALLGINEHFNSEFKHFKRELRHEIRTHKVVDDDYDGDYIDHVMQDTEDDSTGEESK